MTQNPEPNKPFQFEGQWHVYDQAGRLLRWDAGSESWRPIGEAAAPPAAAASPAFAQPGQGAYPAQVTQAPVPVAAAGQYRFASLRTPAKWVYGFLGLTIVATAFYMYGVGQQISVIRDIRSGDTGNFFQLLQDAEDADDTAAAGLGLQVVAMIGTAVVFIWWTRRATCNVHAFNVANPEFTPGWAVGWWFIPFANLVQPLRVINQAWRASDPEAVSSPDRTAWKRVGVTPLVLVWWLMWIIANAVSSSASRVYDDTERLRTLENSATVVLVAEFGVLAAAVLAILVVSQVTARHDAAAQRLGL
jgi:hypothetical protein